MGLDQVAEEVATRILVGRAMETIAESRYARLVIVVAVCSYLGGLIGKKIGLELADVIKDFKASSGK